MSERNVSRRSCAPNGALNGDILPPLPQVPKPPQTEAERGHRLAQEARCARLLHEIAEDLREQNLRRAVKLVHMAYRRQGPLVEFFTDLGSKWQALADSERMPHLLGSGEAD